MYREHRRKRSTENIDSGIQLHTGRAGTRDEAEAEAEAEAGAGRRAEQEQRQERSGRDAREQGT